MIHLKQILLVALPALLFAACSGTDEKIKTETPVKVNTAIVLEKELTLPVHAVGKVYAKEEVKLSFKTGGFIKDLKVDEGQSVKQGQELAVLNLAEIEARLSQAKLGFDKAQRDYKRAYNLHRDSVVTLEQLQNVETALELAQHDLDIARFNYKHSRITAPTNGKVLKRLAEENELIGAGHPVFMFGSVANDWVVRANLSESDIFRIEQNDHAKLSLDAYPGKTLSGKVSEIGTSADPYTGTYEIEITISNKELKLASGLFARFDILPDATNQFDVIPMNALVEANEREGFVYMVNDTNGVVRKKVNIRQIQDEALYVLSDLTQGDVVVTTGSAYITSKSKVEVMSEQTVLAENN